MKTATVYTHKSGSHSWVAEFVSGQDDVKMTVVYPNGKRDQRRMPRAEAVAFVRAQQAKGKPVTKREETYEVKPVSAVVNTLNRMAAVYAPEGLGMLERTVVAPVESASAVVNTLNRIAAKYDVEPVELGFTVPTVEETAVNIVEAVRENTVKDGYYTVVRHDGSHRTYRVRTHLEGSMAGKTIVSRLKGPQNDDDFNYEGVAFLSGGTVTTWRRFRGDHQMEVDFLALVRDSKAAGQAYAKDSGNCYRCGRLLTVPSSIDAGLGPVCAGRE